MTECLTSKEAHPGRAAPGVRSQAMEGIAMKRTEHHTDGASCRSGDLSRRRSPRHIAVLLTSVFLASLMLLCASASAQAAERPTLLFSFGPDGSEASEFEAAGPIAIDQQTHQVYVLDTGHGDLYKFDANGSPVNWEGSTGYISGNKVSGLPVSVGVGERELAVNSQSHTIYVANAEGSSLSAFQADGEPALFTAGPDAGTNELSGFTTRTPGVAVDINGDIYVTEQGAGSGANGKVKIYAPSGAPMAQFETIEPASLGVAPSGDLYVAHRAGPVRKFTPSAFPVTAATTYTPAAQTVNQKESTAIFVDPSTGDFDIVETEIFEGYWIGEYSASGVFKGKQAGVGEVGDISGTVFPSGAVSSGVARDVSSDNLYVSRFGGSVSLPSQVEVLGIVPPPVLQPSIDSSSVAGVAADSATLKAQINPHTLDTTYHFEYGSEDCSIVPDPCAAVPSVDPSIGSGHIGVGVSRLLSELNPGTTYHYRVVAQNSLGTTVSTDQSFTTQSAGLGFELGDRRAWEMVSPPNKFGGSIGALALSEGTTQAAANGNGLAYISSGSLEAAPEGNRLIEPSSELARRGASGWSSEDITPPHARVAPLIPGHASEYKLFSPDLSEALLEPRDDTALSSQTSERAPNLRKNSTPPAYTPLVTGKEGFANVPEGTEFGGDPLRSSLSEVQIAGANKSLSQVVLQSTTPLSADAAPGSLYEWSGGQLKAVSQLPAGEGGAVVAAPLGSNQGSVGGAVSEDGSRVFWGRGTYVDGGGIHLNGLYLRDMLAEETTRLDVVQPGGSGAENALANLHGPAFQGASAAGTAVLFTDSQQLTADASPAERDLYRCEIPAGEAASGCTSLTDLSAPLSGSGESAEVQGVVSALSEDASRVYFVAKGVLDETANLGDETAETGQPNLYLWQQGSGVRFIARLGTGDAPDWGQLDAGVTSFGGSFHLAATASPNGRFFSFVSERRLTQYDNRDAVTGEPLEEVFSYDAADNRLACASCNPSGGEPAGLIDSRQEGANAVDPRGLFTNRRIAALLPETSVLGTAKPTVYRSRSVLDNGRVFFNAADSLVPADSNGNWDVYQYEPRGTGSCSAKSGNAAAAVTNSGCVGLISSGSAEEEAAFLDASESGDDVFFITPAKLSVRDEDNVNDVYDARVDGTPARLEPNAECLGEACQPPAQAPNDPTPASAGFDGPGNVSPKAAQRCPKGRRKAHSKGKSRCVARRGKKRHQHQRKATKNRKASR